MRCSSATHLTDGPRKKDVAAASLLDASEVGYSIGAIGPYAAVEACPMNAPDVLKYGQLTLLDGLDGLPEADWETPGVCGVWSVRQIIAHLASYEAVIADILL